MDDAGITINGVASGAAVTAICGIAVAWIKARFSRTEITPQPLEVKPSPEYACRRDNDLAHENLFARMAAVEKEQARTGAKLEMVLDGVKRIEDKLDRRS